MQRHVVLEGDLLDLRRLAGGAHDGLLLGHVAQLVGVEPASVCYMSVRCVLHSY